MNRERRKFGECNSVALAPCFRCYRKTEVNSPSLAWAQGRGNPRPYMHGRCAECNGRVSRFLAADDVEEFFPTRQDNPEDIDLDLDTDEETAHILDVLFQNCPRRS